MEGKNPKYLRPRKKRYHFYFRLNPKDSVLFGGKKSFAKSTGAKYPEERDKAILQRDLLLAQLKMEIEARRQAKEGKVETLAFEHQKVINELQTKRREAKTDEDRQGLTELLDKEYERVEDSAKQFVSPQGQELYTPVEGNFEIKDKKTNQFVEVAIGKTIPFVSYLKEYEEYRNKNLSEKETKQHIKIISNFGKHIKTVDNLSEIEVQRFFNIKEDYGCKISTLRKYKTALNGYYKFLKKRKLLNILQDKSNPFAEHEFEKKSKWIGINRVAWLLEDLQLLLAEQTTQMKNAPHLRDWILLGMYTGSRLETLANLKRENIVIKQNIRCMYLPEEKQRDMHKMGERYVPITPKCEKIIDRLLAEGNDKYLLPVETDRADKKRSPAISQIFSRHKDNLGFPKEQRLNKNAHGKPTKVFHSTRYTINTHLALMKIPTDKREVLCGWSERERSLRMAETTYLMWEQSYPYNERLKDWKLLDDYYEFI